MNSMAAGGHSYWESLDFCPSPQNSTFPLNFAKKTYSRQIIFCVLERLLVNLNGNLFFVQILFEDIVGVSLAFLFFLQILFEDIIGVSSIFLRNVEFSNL